MVFQEVAIIGLGCLLLGALIGYLLGKKTKIINKLSKTEREKKRVLNNPELLLKKLNENGEIIDLGDTLKYEIIEKDGKQELSLKRIEGEPKEEKKSEEKPEEKEKEEKDPKTQESNPEAPDQDQQPTEDVDKNE